METTVDTRERPQGRLARHRSNLVIAAVFGLAMAVVVLAATGDRSGRPLDPDNPGPDGARALARVLQGQGIDVTVVRGAEALEQQDVGAGVTVLVTSSDQLGPTTADRLLAHSRGADVVVASPWLAVTEALGVDPAPYSFSPREPMAAGCSRLGLEQGLEIAVDRAFAYATGQGCFLTPHGNVLAAAGDGLLLLGAGGLLENDQITRADNAAVALRLLGQHDRLVWYVPEVTDLVGADQVGLTALLPRWLHPALVLLALVAAAGLLWRGRRLGRLEVEPLPVSIKAVETTRSRGRLYRKAGDRTHAAEALRSAARTRAAARLRLPTAVDPHTLVADVARHVDRPADEVARLLAPWTPPPGTDDDLIQLATALAELDREVRRS